MSTEQQPMSLERLKAEHPQAYQAAFDAGVKTERDRCVSLAEGWGKETPDDELLVECIRDGSDRLTAFQRLNESLTSQLQRVRERL